MNRLTDSYVTPALDDILEAVLLAAGEPVSLERIESLFERQPPSRAAIRESLTKLSARLAQSGALELSETASGYRVRIQQRYSPWVSRLWEERPQRYSRALLETLALIAYRQPVTRGDIEEVRGVAVSSSIVRTLHDRGWIRVVGHRDVPGRPAVYATTRAFLDDMGLKSLDALPPMQALQQMETFETAMHEPFADQGGGDHGQGPPGAEAVDDLSAKAAPTPVESKADDTDEHAETASPDRSPSFAELEARLVERARQRDADEQRAAGADTSEAVDDGDDTPATLPAADEAKKDS
ncbi:SMC-Scp complex subunit ScpB [Salinicola aestuarinus]|uniref:SMC-Scp complex subunit ScpB n=1 Tax=Salinicola aestuarinus TaxID=1949082 RepID=UPI000DA19FB5|nr:SMC-Scp complex subunit ScpB [Salinicola aestuarinus]